MPKDNFYHLDQKKQALIFQAAFEEFSDHPFMDASINKIVLNAKISRGSFYLYFKDKLDIYLYIIDIVLEKQAKVFFIETIEEISMDIYQIYRKLFLFNLKLISDGDYSCFFKNLYLGMNYDVWHHIRIKQKSIGEKFLKTLNINNHGDSNESLKERLAILELVNKDLLTKKIFDQIPITEIIKVYDLRISILKKGV